MLVKSTRPILLAFAVLMASSAAPAGESSAEDRATARELMLEGRNLRYDKDLKGALEKFRAADALMGVPTTGIELARTQAQLGLLVEALNTCVRVIRHPSSLAEPAPFKKARKRAKQLRDELRQRIPSLRFVFPSTEQANQGELRVDGVVIPPEARRIPRFVNPGRHEVELTAGPRRQLVHVIVEEGETLDVALALPSTASVEQRPVHADDGPNLWIWGGFTTAAVGGAIGSMAGALAWSKRNDLDDACPNRACPAGEMAAVDSAHRYADVSTYAFIVGGVGAAVGLGALWSSEGDDERGGVSVRVDTCGSAMCLNGTF